MKYNQVDPAGPAPGQARFVQLPAVDKSSTAGRHMPGYTVQNQFNGPGYGMQDFDLIMPVRLKKGSGVFQMQDRAGEIRIFVISSFEQRQFFQMITSAL